MSYKPDESKMMDYLYGELSAEEKRKIEIYLSENEGARKELEELKEVSSVFGKLKDHEVEPPKFIFNDSNEVVVSTSGMNGFFRKSLAIAASISLVVLCGYFTKLNMGWGADGFAISFGDRVEQSFSEDQVNQIVQKALAKNNLEVDKKIDESRSELVQLASNNTGASTVDQTQLDAYFDQRKEETIAILSGLLETSELAQKSYTDELLREFAVYLDVQRQNDLNVIETRMESLADDTQQHQRQTNRILTTMLNTDEQPVVNQY